jgi:TRAP-type C4-dicarboxylate transport system permease small subunit
MPSLKTLETDIIGWTRIISFIGLVGLLIFSAITVGDVLLRWLFNFSMLGVADISQLVIAVATASCFPLVFAEKRSITVRLVGSQLGPRAHALLEAFGTFISLVILALLVWQFWIYTGELAANGETTWHLRLPKAPWYRTVMILLAVCVPVLAVLFINQIKSFFMIGKNGSQKAEVGPGNHKEGGDS